MTSGKVGHSTVSCALSGRRAVFDATMRPAKAAVHEVGRRPKPRSWTTPPGRGPVISPTGSRSRRRSSPRAGTGSAAAPGAAAP